MNGHFPLPPLHLTLPLLKALTLILQHFLFPMAVLFFILHSFVAYSNLIQLFTDMKNYLDSLFKFPLSILIKKEKKKAYDCDL